MGIKRGVSLYSYQQEQFFKRMNVRDQIKEVHSLGTDGIEIIDQQAIRDYPYPSDEWLDMWHSAMAEFNMKAVTMDIYMDVLQFRDHVMLYDECAERLKRDLRLAAKLGFQNVRCLSAVPLEVIKMAIPVAEEVGVRIGKEIHSVNVLDGPLVTELVDYAERRQTEFVGLVPDMGIFQYRPCVPNMNYAVRHGMNPDLIPLAFDTFEQKMTTDEAIAYVQSKIPGVQLKEITWLRTLNMYVNQKPELMKDLVPHIVSIHGKIWEMTEIPGEPGHYEDAAIDYATPLKYLKEGGYEGYINTEYEGQRYKQDRMGEEFMANEVEEVRRHHEMLSRLIGE